MKKKYSFVFLIVLFSCNSLLAGEYKNIFILGDEFVSSIGLEPGETFPNLTEKILQNRGYNVTVVSYAENQMDTNILRRLSDNITRYKKYGMIVVVIGWNDYHAKITPEMTKQNLSYIIQALRPYTETIILCGMRAPDYLPPKYKFYYDRVFSEIAVEFDLIFYPYFLEGVYRYPAYLQGNLTLPNARGVSRLVDRFTKFIFENKLLENNVF